MNQCWSPHRVGHAGQEAHNLDAIQGRDEAPPGVGRLALLDLLAPLPALEAPRRSPVRLLRHLCITRS